jgi:hypothetical protein
MIIVLIAREDYVSRRESFRSYRQTDTGQLDWKLKQRNVIGRKTEKRK